MPRQPRIYETESTGFNTYRVLDEPTAGGGLQLLGAGQRRLVKAGASYLGIGLAFQLLVYGFGSLISPWFWAHILFWWFFLSMDIVSLTMEIMLWIVVLGTVFLVGRHVLGGRVRRRRTIIRRTPRRD